MFLVALALIAAQPAAPQVWRCHREVYDLALYRGEVVAATSGGALRRMQDRSWATLGLGAPAPLRRIRAIGDALEAVDRNGQVVRLIGGTWTPTGAHEAPAPQDLPSPTVTFQGQNLTSVWGSQWLTDPQGSNVIRRNAADGDYALLAYRQLLIAATSSGVYELGPDGWVPDALPIDLPVTRPQGYAEAGAGTPRHGRARVVGGIGGLFVDRGRGWVELSREPVRQILPHGEAIWVLYGSGSVDKIDIARGQIGADVLYGSVGRPWASCLAAAEDKVLCGGQGTWSELAGAAKSEHIVPEIGKDVVTAIAARGAVRWIGTQASGLLRFGQGPVGRWNPGNGLSDPWVTALQPTADGLCVATSWHGLYLLNGDSLKPVDSPTQRVRCLARWNGDLVVGGMDGAWVRRRGRWQTLPTQGEETTALIPGPRLTVVTASGVWSLPRFPGGGL